MGLIIWLRNLVFIVLILSAVYAVLSISGRHKAKKRLKAEYDAEQLGVSQKEYLARGLAKYDRSMKPKLFLFVFILPIVIIAGLMFLAQYG